MRSADGITGGVSEHVVHGDRIAELVELRNDLVIPDTPPDTEHLEAILKRSRLRLGEVGEHVDLDSVVIDRQFNTRDQLDGKAGGNGLSLMDTGERVVICEGDRRQVHSGGLLDDDAWCVGPIGCV